MDNTLMGKRILITREKQQNKLFAEQIQKFKGVPVEVPLLTISYSQHTNVNKLLEQVEWVFFTSANGVRSFFANLPDRSLLRNKRFATVGTKTSAVLQDFQLESDFIPSTFNAETMGKEFFLKYPDANFVLLVKGNLASYHLEERFLRKGIQFQSIITYETKINRQSELKLNELIMERKVDYLTFTSPSTVKAFVSLLHEELLQYAFTLPTFCIGSTTAKEAEQLLFQQIFVPDLFTIEGMIDYMHHYTYREGVT